MNRKSNKTRGSRKWKRGKHNWHKSNCHLLQSDWCSASLQATASLEDNPQKHSSFYCWARHYVVQNIPLVSSDLCPSCVPPNLLPNSSLLNAKGQSEKQRKPWHSKLCSATAKRLVCYQHCLSHKSKTQHYPGWCEESYFHPSQIQRNSWNKISVWYICPRHPFSVWPFKYLVFEKGSNTIFWLAHGEFIIIVEYLWDAFNFPVIQENT